MHQVGLDAAGKTTILYKLKLGEIVTTIPTIGDACLFVASCRISLVCRVQCGDRRVQEHLFYRVGCWWTGQGALRRKLQTEHDTCVCHIQIRPLWRHYFQNTQGLIFVVDSNDRDRVGEARDELHRMLNEVILAAVMTWNVI